MTFRVYLITPDARPETVETVRSALSGVAPGTVAVQLRDKHATEAELVEAGRRLREVTRTAGAELYLNGAVAVAREVGADGVHLPESGPPVAAVGEGLWVGCSRHDRAGLLEAEATGARFATLSPIGEVPGKAAPIGVAGFAEAVAGLRLDVYALGGVGPDEVAALREAGAAGVAVIRAVFAAPDPSRALANLVASWPEA